MHRKIQTIFEPHDHVSHADPDLSLLGVPVIATIAILAGLFAYSKGYRININKQERQ